MTTQPPINNLALTVFSFFLFCFDLIGPEVWPELFPMASGHRQSPVNISRDSSTRGSTLKMPLTYKYVADNNKSLINPGYSWRVDVNGEGSCLTGGPLSSQVFLLEQYHCHWGMIGILIDFHYYYNIVINK